MKYLKLNKALQAGFSLVEMAVVLVILGLVIGSLLLPLEAQRQQVFIVQTRNQLETIQKALIGYAVANGRLPCPATSGSSGLASPAAGGTCTTMVGLVPAATLGITPVDTTGVATDAWNNQIGYAVTQINTSGGTDVTLTTSAGMSGAGVSSLPTKSGLMVCAATTSCSSSLYLTNNAVAVIYSTGKTAATGAGDADEAENLDGDSIFISRDPSATFDQYVLWLSPYVLYEAMVKAGQLN